MSVTDSQIVQTEKESNVVNNIYQCKCCIIQKEIMGN